MLLLGSYHGGRGRESPDPRKAGPRVGQCQKWQLLLLRNANHPSTSQEQGLFTKKMHLHDLVEVYYIFQALYSGKRVPGSCIVSLYQFGNVARLEPQSQSSSRQPAEAAETEPVQPSSRQSGSVSASCGSVGRFPGFEPNFGNTSVIAPSFSQE